MWRSFLRLSRSTCTRCRTPSLVPMLAAGARPAAAGRASDQAACSHGGAPLPDPGRRAGAQGLRRPGRHGRLAPAAAWLAHPAARLAPRWCPPAPEPSTLLGALAFMQLNYIVSWHAADIMRINSRPCCYAVCMGACTMRAAARPGCVIIAS